MCHLLAISTYRSGLSLKKQIMIDGGILWHAKNHYYNYHTEPYTNKTKKHRIECDMSQDHPANSAVDDFETLTVCTPTTTADNTVHNSPKSENFHSSTPWPGRAFIIRSHDTGKVITFLDGRIILDKAGGLGTFRWRCVEKKGWLGFRDPASAKYLGYDKQGGWVRCLVDKHNDWEYICPRKRPEGGYVLLVLLEKELVPLGVHVQETENGMEHRIKIRDWNSEGIVWDFIEVPG